MSQTSTLLQNAILNEVFVASDLSAALSMTSLSVVWLSLHTANPTDGGSQTSSEVAYTGYARTSIVRTTTGWTVDAINSRSLNAQLFGWPPCTGGTATAKYLGIGTASSGAGQLLYYCPLVASGKTWMVGITNIRSSAGAADNWITAAAYCDGLNPTLANTDRIAIARVYEEGMHTNLSAATDYFIFNLEGTWPGPQAFQIETTSGSGTAVDISPGDSRCSAIQFIQMSPLSISSGITPTIPALGLIAYGV